MKFCEVLLTPWLVAPGAARAGGHADDQVSVRQAALPVRPRLQQPQAGRGGVVTGTGCGVISGCGVSDWSEVQARHQSHFTFQFYLFIVYD